MKTRVFLAFLGFAASVSASPVTRDQLAAMARARVDPGVMRAIVERDCVDFDVDAGNAAELSRTIPAPVLEAAIVCRRSAAPSPAAVGSPATPTGASPAPPAGASPAPSVGASPAPPAPTSSASSDPVPVAAPPAPAAASRAPVAPALAPGGAKIRLRAVFIGESNALRCTASIDGVEAATFVKEEQGAFGEAVPRDRLGRETGYLPVSPGAHHVVFRCDPRNQTVAVDVEMPAGESRTIEIGETTLRHWKFRGIQTP